MKKTYMIYALSLFLILCIGTSKVSAANLDNVQVIDYSEKLPSDQQLIELANKGILYSDENVKVSKVSYKIDDYNIVSVVIDKRIKTEIMGNVQTSFYNSTSTSAITHDESFSIGTVIMYMEYRDVYSNGNHRKVTAFGHAFRNYESLFGSPVSLTSYVTQDGEFATKDFIQYSGQSETSATLIKTSSFFTMQYANTYFQYYLQTGAVAGAGMKTTVRWRNKNGTYSNFLLNFTLYISGF